MKLPATPDGRPDRRLGGRFIAAAAGALVLGLALSAPAAAEKFKIKVGVSTPPGYSYNVGLEEFKRLVESGTNNDVSVSIFPSAQLGGEVEMAKNVQLGTLEATIVSTSNASPFHKPLQVLSVPYLVNSIACGLQVLHGPVGQDFSAALLKKAGLRTLGWYTYGMRQVFNTKRDVKSVADLKGLKIRVPPDKYLEMTWRTLGASPTPLPFPEVFSALQQGVIDGDANPISSVKQFKWYEVVKHVSYANVAVGLSPFIINERFFKKLPAAYQEVVTKAAMASEAANRAADAKSTTEAVAFLKKEGVVFSDVNLDEFRTAMKPVMDTAKKEFGAELVDQVMKSQGGC
ncbi:MAG: TRAP transporter substrate-binding protein [Hyphomicrobiales bacterium]|nr:TRAP transporter substrate-binding protein [Hyphomicrobiales bacterium]MCP5370798.1 TRAP transporter substrate-binding protein [Hyphomicrobiales bacterium]